MNTIISSVSLFVHTYMWDIYTNTFYPWATPIGTMTAFGIVTTISVLLSWFVFGVLKPQPGCIFEGKVPFLPLYVGDPRGYKDPRYRCKINGGQG